MSNIEKMIKDARGILTIRQELLFEAEVNYKFNPSEYNRLMVETWQAKVAEKENYISVLEGMQKPTEKNITPKPRQLSTVPEGYSFRD